MAQANVVFLIDINGIQREPYSETPVKVKEEQSESTIRFEDSRNESKELFSLSTEDAQKGSGKLTPNEQLEWLKDFVLLTLHKEANVGESYDYGKVQWCYKFFDSTRHTDFKDGRSFLPFDHESFSNFEKQLHQRIKSSSGDTNSDAVSLSQFGNAPVKYLSDMLKIITGSLQWPEKVRTGNLNQSRLSRNFNASDEATHNYVYAFFRVPRTEKELMEFTDLKPNFSSKEFTSALLPVAFSNTFHFKYGIQLNFVDMWTAPENESVSYLYSWNGEYPRQIAKCLQFLHKGKVIPIPVSDFSNLKNVHMRFGLIPYNKYLRTALQQASLPNENVPSHILRLADRVKPKVNQAKTSPEFETGSSIGLSLKSGNLTNSLLDSSINVQSKVLRPYGFDDRGRGAVEDQLAYHRQKMAEIKAQDRSRERKRKRLDLDLDYDMEEEYSMPSRYRQGRGLLDDSFAPLDSAEVDSVCEKEQRLENWINDGVFTKRKKSLDTTTTAVPMSRPALNRSTHMFQEPAPKPVASRGKKMLANVERQKFKENSVTQHKRRSSEGLEAKRMLHEQEVELKALKHRLKIHLTGELDDEEDDPLSWLRKFSKALRDFSDMILAEENPSLIALAQALVNSASVKFTQHFLANVRKRLRNDRISAKNLLEEILLTKFATLNLKIINALDVESSKDRKSAKEEKMLAFREAELQIILRVEIAWCFVTPKEDATDDLVMEIVRLLQIIGAYRSNVAIENFMNSVLLPNYIHGTRFMRELYKKMNLPVPFELSIEGSPIPSTSRRDDDSSVISSTSSANLYPEDSASQLHIPYQKRHRSSATIKSRNAAHAHHSGRRTNSGSKKQKRQIMVATSNPNMSQYVSGKADSLRRNDNGSSKISPKRVRRNLFDVQKKDKKDSKTLLALTSRIKSPAFKSPKGKSSPSAFFRAARSRKQLTMNSDNVDPQSGSPATDPDGDVLCPATPGDRVSVVSRNTPSNPSTPGAQGRTHIVQESPEVYKNEYEGRPVARRVASLSFYSTGSGAPKSRAWEKSESKLKAAKLKDTVDLHKKDGLNLSDLEWLSRSPDTKSETHDVSADTPGTHVSVCNDSLIDRNNREEDQTNDSQNDPSPPALPSSPFTGFSLHQCTGPAPDLTNPEIHSLITSENFPTPLTLLSRDKEINSTVGGDDLTKSPSLPATPGSSNSLQTPSKRVQFNLNENLVNTPCSSRRPSCVTPRSILKETHDPHGEV